jgi:hypothetical protein
LNAVISSFEYQNGKKNLIFFLFCYFIILLFSIFYFLFCFDFALLCVSLLLRVLISFQDALNWMRHLVSFEVAQCTESALLFVDGSLLCSVLVLYAIRSCKRFLSLGEEKKKKTFFFFYNL